MKFRLLLSSLILLLFLVYSPIVFAASPYCLSLNFSYDSLTGMIRAEVTADRDISLANYDLLLDWDHTAFRLNGITNEQKEKFSSFIVNTTPGHEREGAISATSNGSNVSIDRFDVIAVYLFAPVKDAKPDHYLFTLTIKEAADENGTALTWKGDIYEFWFPFNPSTESDILSLDRSTGQDYVRVYCCQENSILFHASYGVEGELINLNSVRLDDQSLSIQEYRFPVPNNAATVRCFLLDSQFRPLCISMCV